MWIGALAPFGVSLAAETVGWGDQIAATCASCHGADPGDAGIPAIIGKDEQEIIDAMRAYSASKTPSHVMHAVALSLSEDELLAVARAVAARRPTTP
jgi:cytochrome c553